MKKFYVLGVLGIILTLISNPVSAQYTATNSGSWSNNATWAPGVKPPSICSACNITINGGVVVTLDVSQKLTNGAVLSIGSDALTPAALVIPASSATSISTGFNILLDGSSPNLSKIVIANANSGLTALAAGDYDGVFVDLFNGNFDVKIIGNKNTGFHTNFFLGQPAPDPNPPPQFSSVAGPSTLSSNGTLPIILYRFDASLSNGKVDLSWTTLVEINADHFDVERSSDAAHWQTLGTVQATGNSETKIDYSFVDQSPSTGANYYRLKLVDRDGKYKYSAVRVVRGSLIKGYSVFPNPARDFVNVTISAEAPEELTFRLTNLFGQILQERKFTHAAGTTVSLPVSNYAAGTYMLSISGNDGSQLVNKVLVAR